MPAKWNHLKYDLSTINGSPRGFVEGLYYVDNANELDDTLRYLYSKQAVIDLGENFFKERPIVRFCNKDTQMSDPYFIEYDPIRPDGFHTYSGFYLDTVLNNNIRAEIHSVRDYLNHLILSIANETILIKDQGDQDGIIRHSLANSVVTFDANKKAVLEPRSNFSGGGGTAGVDIEATNGDVFDKKAIVATGADAHGKFFGINASNDVVLDTPDAGIDVTASDGSTVSKTLVVTSPVDLQGKALGWNQASQLAPLDVSGGVTGLDVTTIDGSVVSKVASVPDVAALADHMPAWDSSSNFHTIPIPSGLTPEEKKIVDSFAKIIAASQNKFPDIYGSDINKASFSPAVRANALYYGNPTVEDFFKSANVDNAATFKRLTPMALNPPFPVFQSQWQRINETCTTNPLYPSLTPSDDRFKTYTLTSTITTGIWGRESQIPKSGGGVLKSQAALNVDISGFTECAGIRLVGGITLLCIHPDGITTDYIYPDLKQQQDDTNWNFDISSTAELGKLGQFTYVLTIPDTKPEMPDGAKILSIQFELEMKAVSRVLLPRS